MRNEQWVIYDHPKDHPDYFVVRRWTILRQPIPDQYCFTAKQLEEARAVIPAGFIKTLPTPNDDPVILEVWV